MPLTGPLTFTLDENHHLSSSIPNMTNHQIQILDVAVRQYNTLYSTVGFKENLAKTKKSLSSHDIKIDKVDSNYICDILNRNTDNPISISYKEDNLINPCSPLTVFAISKLVNCRVCLFSSRRKPVYIHSDSSKTLVLLHHIDSVVLSNISWFLMKVLDGEEHQPKDKRSYHMPEESLIDFTSSISKDSQSLPPFRRGFKSTT
ncbi:hypothetical protein K501DRAFT_276177 [Backusella circina FSU 941]|nr:hypothetical protein K501DRAFT_276177 [Backusella circina FSU 941]